jgi:hypothetical protein
MSRCPVGDFGQIEQQERQRSPLPHTGDCRYKLPWWVGPFQRDEFRMSAQTDSDELPRVADKAQIKADLQVEDIVSQDFEFSLRAALAATGGALLFQMHIDNETAHEHVAAISVGKAEARRFFLVILPFQGGALKVEPVETSGNPLAGIAAAYAGLVDVFDIAA